MWAFTISTTKIKNCAKFIFGDHPEFSYFLALSLSIQLKALGVWD